MPSTAGMNGPIPHGTPPAAYAGGAAAPSPAAAAARDLELDMLDMMPMRTTAVGAADEGGGAAGLVEGAVEGARGFLEGFRQMLGGEGEAADVAEGEVDVEGGMSGAGGSAEREELMVLSDEDDWEDEGADGEEADAASSAVSSTLDSDEDSDGGGRRRRRRKKRGRRRRNSTTGSVGSIGSAGGDSASSFVSSVTSVTSVSSEGLRKAFEESLQQALQAAADADEANAERRRLADEYLDVSLYIYDQFCGRLQHTLEQVTKRGGSAARYACTRPLVMWTPLTPALVGTVLLRAWGNSRCPRLRIRTWKATKMRSKRCLRLLVRLPAAAGAPRATEPTEFAVAELAESTLTDALIYAKKAGERPFSPARATRVLTRRRSNSQRTRGASTRRRPTRWRAWKRTETRSTA